ncbi:hypothetical protein HIM_12298 [Hirsutella minnesotensis 3608]|uniref:Uncharacterized protein n=1 Tax=Hirsutella minnesotensis 3608 TaxID=1043627 RepID=A0A0F7ZW40_9HYPO|nr:hypothetical protein HIM_12298 [Hirsutella minnesotensis 3608]
MDSLLPLPGLWDGLELGNWAKHLAAHVDDLVVNYWSHIASQWTKIMAGIENCLHLVDSPSVRRIQRRAPGFSRAGRARIKRDFESKNNPLFPAITDADMRRKLKQNVLSIRVMIPSIETFHDDMRYLSIGAKILEGHILSRHDKKKTIGGNRLNLFQSLREDWGESAVQFQTGHHSFAWSRISPTPRLAFMQLLLAALRYFPHLSWEAPLQDLGDTRMGASVDARYVGLLCRTARELGFSNDKIDAGLKVGNDEIPIKYNKVDETYPWRGGKPSSLVFQVLHETSFVPQLCFARVEPAEEISATCTQAQILSAFFTEFEHLSPTMASELFSRGQKRRNVDVATLTQVLSPKKLSERRNLRNRKKSRTRVRSKAMGASLFMRRNDKNRLRYPNVTSQIGLTKPTPSRITGTYATESDIDMLDEPEIPNIESGGQIGVNASEDRPMTGNGTAQSCRSKKPRDPEKLSRPLRPRGPAISRPKRQSSSVRGKRKPRAKYTHITSQDGSAMSTPCGITDDCSIESNELTMLEPMIPNIDSDESMRLGTPSSAERTPESPRGSPLTLAPGLAAHDWLREKSPTAFQSPVAPSIVPEERENTLSLPEKNPRRLQKTLAPEMLPSQGSGEQPKAASALSAERLPENSHPFGETIRTTPQTDSLDANGTQFDSDDANAPIPDIMEDIDETWSGFRDDPDLEDSAHHMRFRDCRKQLEEAALQDLPVNSTVEDLPKIFWKNRRFVQEASLARKGAKGRKSWIRSHGMFFIELNNQDQPIGHVWCCSRRDTKGRPEFFSVRATSSAADHLRNHVSGPGLTNQSTDLPRSHRITPTSQSSPRDDDSAIDLDSDAPPKRRRLDQSTIPKAKVKAIQELSVGFVIDSDVPFTIFEHKFLKELFYRFDHELALQVPWSSSSMTRELQRIFGSEVDVVRAELGTD